MTFCYQDLELLYGRVNIEFIKDSKVYAVSIDNLELTEYLPERFNEVKQVSGNNDILNSLISPYNYRKLISLIREEGGRSEAFIFVTADQKFIIKTISKADKRQFISKMAVKYFERIENCSESKLVRILGIFKIKPMKQNLIIMENLLVNKEKCVIFDLKGSKVSRLVKGIEDPQLPPLGRVLKDTNFLQYGNKIRLSEEIRVILLQTLQKDFEFLRDCGVIDYSILLGIYVKRIDEKLSRKPLPIAEDGTQFTLGIIDIFQEYNFLKASEKTIKTIFNKKEDISIATPLDYYNRILEFTFSVFITSREISN